MCSSVMRRANGFFFVLWDGIVFEDILYQMGRIRDTFYMGPRSMSCPEEEIPGRGSGVLSIIQTTILSKYR